MRDWLVRLLSGPRRWLWLAVLSAAALALSFEFYWCIFRCHNDFLWHRRFGIAFLENQVYAEFGQHYLPARAMIDAATAWLPYRLDRALWLLATCAGLAWCIRFWSRIAAPVGRRGHIAIALALATMAWYVHRDLRECGLQLFLFLLLSVGLWSLLRGHFRVSGITLGLAAVYKITPIIFLPYLVWKREWRAAGWMSASTVFLCLLPAAFVGWQKNVDLHRQWLSFAQRTLATEDPTENGVERPSPRNQSLLLLFARLVQHYPVGHPMRDDGPQMVQLASLSPIAARRITAAALFALAAVLAWRFRKRLDTVVDSTALAGEWATVCALVAVLSPLCWLQHLVLVIPAGILFASRAAAGQARTWQWVAASLSVVFILLVHRDLLGSAVCGLLNCLAPHTLAALLLASAALGAPTSEGVIGVPLPIRRLPAPLYIEHQKLRPSVKA